MKSNTARSMIGSLKGSREEVLDEILDQFYGRHCRPDSQLSIKPKRSVFRSFGLV